MKCGKCGKEFDTSDKVCPKCGTVFKEESSSKNSPKLIIPNVDEIEDFTLSKIDVYQKEYEEKEEKVDSLEYRYCPKCGLTVSEGQDFCSNCGEKVGEKTSTLENNSVSKKKPLFWILLFGGEFLFLFVIPFVLLIVMLILNVSDRKSVV